MCLSLTGNYLSPFLVHGFKILGSTCNFCSLNSTRKRQSVVCRYPDGRLVLYCKVIIS
jgi:magnesium-transporting ATPase (P-type)